MDDGIDMSLVQINFYSHQLRKNTNVTIVLPYGNWQDIDSTSDLSEYGKKEYPSLYLLHGYQGDNLSWLRNSEVEKFAERHQCIVIMPSGDNSFYINLSSMKLNYENFIISELRRYIEKTFPISRNREYRAIAGLSMGGYGALRLGFLYPELYAYIGAFSPPYVTTDMDISPFFHSEFREASTLFFGEPETWGSSTYDTYKLLDELKSRCDDKDIEVPYIYLACGEQDSLIEGNRKMAKKLATSEFNYKYVEGSGGHIWSYWNRHLSKFMSEFSKYTKQ